MDGKWGLAGRSKKQHYFVGHSSLCRAYPVAKYLNWGEEFGKCCLCLETLKGVKRDRTPKAKQEKSS